ncbi:MAG: SurA N-terminal domain-containing protein [Deltaproteobacteria bacterium]|nr:SurA N-terminal domain-containing protein [Deltaproteobacteria bacterium]
MLDMMRRHSKSWLIKVFLGLIIFVFIFYFGTLQNSGSKANLIAEVGKIPITNSAYAQTYQQLYNSYQAQLGKDLDAEMVKNLGLKKMAREKLVEEAIIAHKAEEFGISISAEDVEGELLKDPRFLTDHNFDQQKFADFLRKNKIEPNEYLQNIAKGILMQRVAAVIQSSMRVSPQEVSDLYAMSRLKMRVDFVVVPFREEFIKIAPSKKDLEEYLIANGKDFRLPERYRVKYIAYLGSNYAGGIKISEEEARQHYERWKERFKKSPADSFKNVRQAVEADLRAISGMYAAGDKAKKDYEEIYQRENWDNFAKEKNLKVSKTELFSLDNIPAPFNKMENFSGALNSLKTGSTVRIVSDDKGYYVLALAERLDSALPSVDSVKGELEIRYKQEKAFANSEQKATEMIAKIKAGGPFASTAKELGLEVRDSGLFSLDSGKIPILGGGPELAEALFSLSKTNPYSQVPLPTTGGFAVLSFKERVEPSRTEKITNEDELRRALYFIKSREITANWFKSVKQRLLAEGTLKYHRDEADL